MTARSVVLSISLAILLCGTPAAFAQFAPISGSTIEAWKVQVTPYFWGSGLVGQLGIGDRTADVDASFSNILNHLHFAAMGVADARWNRFVAVTDFFYTDLRGQRATPGPLFSGVNPQQKLFIFTPEVGYRAVDSSGTSVEIVGGVRYWHLNSELQFQPAVLPGVDVQASRGWVDGIGGGRIRQAFSHDWWVSAYSDVGAGGSTHTYQIAGTVGVDLHQHFSLVAGYRYLVVKYDTDVLLSTTFKGPLFGFTIRF